MDKAVESPDVVPEAVADRRMQLARIVETGDAGEEKAVERFLNGGETHGAIL